MDNHPEQQITKDILPRVNLQIVRAEAQNTYQNLLEDGRRLLPYSHLALELAKRDSPIGTVMGDVMRNVGKLMDIGGLTWYGEPEKGEGEEWEKVQLGWRKSSVGECSQKLKAMGVSVEPDALVAPLGDDVTRIVADYFKSANFDGILELISAIQREYVGVLYATRIFSETELLFKTLAPGVPWPKESRFRFTSEHRGRNGGWKPNSETGHLLYINHNSRITDDLINDINGNKLLITNSNNAVMITAAHEEAGHAGFFELFPREQICQIFTLGDREKSMMDSLSEGYAIMVERVAGEMLTTLNPETPEWEVNDVEVVERVRKKRLAGGRDDVAERTYLDGYRIARKLIWQLNLYNKTKEDQVAGLADYFRNVDIEKIATLTYKDEEYQNILKNPMESLPMRS